jgi:hypothetical protein
VSGIVRKLFQRRGSELIFPCTRRAKVAPIQLSRHRLAELASSFERVMVVKAGVDASPKDLVHQVACIFENVLMNPVFKCQAVRYDVYMSGTKKGWRLEKTRRP